MRYVILLLLAIAAAIIYTLFFRSPGEFRVKSIPSPVVREFPSRILSTLVDSQRGKIFLPLNEQDAKVPVEGILAMREKFLRLLEKPNTKEDQKIYIEGISVCELLFDAAAEREKHCKRLADSRKKGYGALVDDPRGKFAEMQKRKEFYEGAIIKSWDATSVRILKEIDRKQAAIHSLERQ